MLSKQQKRIHKRRRIRAKVKGTAVRPRCAMFKSNMALSVQLVDDTVGTTLLGLSTLTIKSGTKKEKAEQLGEQTAKQAIGKNITHIVFDRGGFTYGGIVEAFANAARKGGLVF